MCVVEYLHCYRLTIVLVTKDNFLCILSWNHMPYRSIRMGSVVIHTPKYDETHIFNVKPENIQ